MASPLVELKNIDLTLGDGAARVHVLKKARRLNMHRRTLQRILAKRAPR